jgi:hypothetical protein
MTDGSEGQKPFFIGYFHLISRPVSLLPARAFSGEITSPAKMTTQIPGRRSGILKRSVEEGQLRIFRSWARVRCRAGAREGERREEVAIAPSTSGFEACKLFGRGTRKSGQFLP